MVKKFKNPAQAMLLQSNGAFVLNCFSFTKLHVCA